MNTMNFENSFYNIPECFISGGFVVSIIIPVIIIIAIIILIIMPPGMV